MLVLRDTPKGARSRRRGHGTVGSGPAARPGPRTVPTTGLPRWCCLATTCVVGRGRAPLAPNKITTARVSPPSHPGPSSTTPEGTIPACPPAGPVVPDVGGAACRTEAAASHRGRPRIRRRRHERLVTDSLVLPGLLVVAPVTVRFAFARSRLAQDAWEAAYRLASGRLWWRCLRFASSRGELHPCRQRLAQHLSWQLGEQVTLTNIRSVLDHYAAYHQLSLRTAWTDWRRLVEAGWLSPTRAPANQGSSQPQGPGSGRAARYVLTAPAALVDQLRARSPRPAATALVTFSSQEAFPSPSVPPPRHDHRRGWITLRAPTMAERRDASALLAGCHPRWRHQRPEDSLLTRPDWHHLLPLVAQVQRQRPDVGLPTMLTDRVRSARSLPAVLAWRLWQLLRQPPPQHTPPEEPARPHPPPKHVEESDDRHLAAVRTLGGPAAVRAALTTAPTAFRPPPKGY